MIKKTVIYKISKILKSVRYKNELYKKKNQYDIKISTTQNQ